jgi:hypothetical protein
MITDRNGFGNDSFCELYTNAEEFIQTILSIPTIQEKSHNNSYVQLSGFTIPSQQPSSVDGLGKKVWYFYFGNDKEGYNSSYLIVNNINIWEKKYYCIDFWLKMTEGNSSIDGTYIFGKFEDTNNYLECVQVSSWIYYKIKVKGIVEVVLQYYLSYNTWYHIAFNRKDSEYTMYVDGNNVDTDTSSGEISITSSFVIGDINDGDSSRTCNDIYMNAFRISVGNSRWNKNFIPPNRQY